MCGLTGVIFGKQKRSQAELETLKDIFTTMFIFSEERGRHASGIATLSTNGKHSLYKLPVPPSRMISLTKYNEILDNINDKTTILMGHSRWKTVGTEYNNNNNQPIVSGPIIGEHNGTISNHKELFKTFQFKRFAEVDSEILFRMAEASLQDGVIQTSTFSNYVSHCQGSLSCVYVSKTDPESVYLYHGDKPLFLYYHPGMQVLIYSSARQYIEEALDGDSGWIPITFPENKMYQTNYKDFRNIVSEPFFYRRNVPLTMCVDKSKAQRALTF